MHSKCTNPLICKKHGTLVGVDEHAHRLYTFMLLENPYNGDSIREWFQIASGIIKVDYYSDRFGTFSAYCDTAAEYENDKSKYHQSLITHLTRFTYIFAGLESFIDNLNLPACPHQRGKYNAVANFLKENFDKTFALLPE
jgi:hypothetical protein